MPHSQPQNTEIADEKWMRIAIEEAHLAEKAGEVPIGACIVSATEELLARGQNRVIRDNDPTAHAELVALRAAGESIRNYRLLGCALFVTLEPCAMCAGAMVHARIARLVFGAYDPKSGACGSVLGVINHPQLNHTMEVVPYVLADECGDLLRRFFQSRR